MNSNFDTSKLLPTKFKDKTIDSFLHNTVDQFLSKKESSLIYGYIGKKSDAIEVAANYITHSDLDRKVNVLEPLYVSKTANETAVLGFAELIQTLVLQGVDYNTLNDWCKGIKKNLTLPINYDKFVNHQEYLWIGDWVKLGYDVSSILNVDIDTIIKSNPELIPEYYVIESSGNSDWSKCNLWVHRQDLLTFAVNNGLSINLPNAKMPIIEYSSSLQMNEYISNGIPSDSGIHTPQIKSRTNQIPLFDLYYFDGTHSGLTSSIFFYKESSNSTINKHIERRVITSANSDFVYGFGVYHPITNELLRFKQNNELFTIWQGNETDAIQYVTIDQGGTFIDLDMYENYTDYYWNGKSSDLNHLNSPDYYTCGEWSNGNWIHYSKIDSNVRQTLPRANRPIFNFNASLSNQFEPKTAINIPPKLKNFTSITGGYVFGLYEDIPEQNALKQIPDLSKNAFMHNGRLHYYGLLYPNYENANQLVALKNANNVTIRLKHNQTGELVNVHINNGIVNVNGITTTINNTITLYSGNVIEVIAPNNIVADCIYAIKGTSNTQEIKTLQFDNFERKLSLGDIFRTDFTDEYKESNPSLRNGTWKIPNIAKNGIVFFDGNEIKQGDISLHLMSVIEAQTNLIGAPFGSNNWRNITPNYGLGGKIISFNEQFNLLAGLMLAKIDLIDVINFIQKSYETMIGKVYEFVVTSVTENINSAINPKTNYSNLKEYLNTSAYTLSTMPIKGLTLTLPYIGLTHVVKPTILIDPVLNVPVIRHHDGHISKFPVIEQEFIKSLVSKKVKRSTGEYTSGIVAGPIPPMNAYTNQLWLDLASMTLYVFNVYDDIGTKPDSAEYGTFAYNRASGEMWQYNGTWVSLGNDNIAQEQAWVKIDVQYMYVSLMLMIEQELYNACPIHANIDTVIPSEKIFLEFAASHKILDPYASNYDANNPFTWNYYNSILIDGSICNYATWFDLYESIFNTPRPDLYPWLALNIQEQDYNSSIDIETELTNIYGWSPIKNGELRAPITLQSNDNLIHALVNPPYEKYTYGQNGPFEYTWKQTVDYQTAIARTKFINNPLEFLNKFWGIDYNQDVDSGNKSKTVKLHGDSITSIISPSMCMTNENVTIELINNPPNQALIDGKCYLFDNLPNSIEIQLPRNNVYQGDKFVCNNGIIDVIPTNQLKINGLAQVISHYFKEHAIDIEITKVLASIKNLEVKMGYRSNKLLESNLSISTNYNTLSEQAYTLHLHESCYQQLLKYTGFKVTLYQQGTIELRNGIVIPGKTNNGRGTDWVFRLDSFSPVNKISYYEMHDDDVRTFFALDGIKSQDEWEIPLTKGELKTIQFPILITGIQNVIDFISGYIVRLNEIGIYKTISEKPLIDSKGRIVEWQLEIEEFINNLFSGANPGFAHIINPYYKKIWIESPLFLSELNVKPFYSKIYNISGKYIDSFRVFRDNTTNLIVADDDITAAEFYMSKFEHYIIFENKDASTIIYDYPLGLETDRFFIHGYGTNAGIPTSNGNFLNGNTFESNIEGSIYTLNHLYDSTNIVNDEIGVRARALIGHEHKDYWNLRNATKQSAFRFWQGAIKNKGTNNAIDAYLNCKSYTTASLDEYWAVKVGIYGDADIPPYALLNYHPDDISDTTRFLLLESGDDLSNSDKSGMYDYDVYEKALYDAFSFIDLASHDDIRGSIIVKPNDESRWLGLNSLNTINSFEADIVQYNVTYSTAGINTIPYKADNIVFYDNGNIVDDIEILTSDVIRIPSRLVNVPLVAYITLPPIKNFSNTRSLYKNQEVGRITWWDPARGYLNSEATVFIDYEQSTNPAKYTNSIYQGNISLQAWDDEQVNKIWLNTKTLHFQPYYDVKLTPSAYERISSWGSIAEYGSYDVYEWIKSSVTPYEYQSLVANANATGEVAISNLLKSNRTWYQRSIIWLENNQPSFVGDSKISYSNNVLINDTEFPQLVLNSKLITTDESGNPDKEFIVHTTNPVYVLGSTTSNNTPILSSTDYFELLDISIDTGLAKYLGNVTGPIKFNFEVANGINQVRITYVNLQKSQVMAMPDTPVFKDTIFDVRFEQLGLTIKVKSKIGHNDALPGGITNESSIRKQLLGAAIGAPDNNVYVRESLSVTPIANYNDFDTTNWIISVVPSDLLIDAPKPNNKYSAKIGEWKKVESNFNLISSLIKQERLNTIQDRDGKTYPSFKQEWSSWEHVTNKQIEIIYDGSELASFCSNHLSCSQTSKVYINGKLSDAVFKDTYMMLPYNPIIGSSIVLIEPQYQMTKEDKEFDENKSDPLIFTKYAIDMPYSLKEIRNENGLLERIDYFFWVKNRLDSDTVKPNISIIAQLLKSPKTYAYVQGLRTNPDRYALLNITGLQYYNGDYQLELMNDKTIRANGNEKPLHHEWKLIRQKQYEKIDVQLWNKLVDSMCGQTINGVQLPFDMFTSYDKRHTDSTSAYGLNDGQVLLPSSLAIEVVKHTLLNTNCTKFNPITRVLETDFIDIDLNTLDIKLSNIDNIRTLMDFIYTTSSPKQINELFFACVYEALSYTNELDGIFKTSYISLNEVRTIDSVYEG